MRISTVWKTFGLVAALVAVAGVTTLSTDSASGQEETGLAFLTSSQVTEEQLDAGVPSPERVFVQQTTAFPGRGDVLISVELSDAQRSAKTAEGTMISRMRPSSMLKSASVYWVSVPRVHRRIPSFSL
jgi:hypothetical protein